MKFPFAVFNPLNGKPGVNFCIYTVYAFFRTGTIRQYIRVAKGARKGQHGIRINDQWRICFKWKDGNAFDVEIVDYH